MLASMPETINRDMSLRHSCLPPGRPGARALGIPEKPVRPTRHPIHDGPNGQVNGVNRINAPHRLDVPVANFWHVLPQQLYGELARLEEEGLVQGRVVMQERRPNKRVYSIGDAGRRELIEFTRLPARPTAIKDDLLVKFQAANVGDMEAMARSIDQRRELAEQRLAMYNQLTQLFLRGRDEETFLRTARRIGPCLNLRRGRDLETANIAWYRWAARALRARAGTHRSGRARAGSDRKSTR